MHDHIKPGKISEEELQKKRDEIVKIYYEVFSSPMGKTVLEDMKKRFWYDHPIFDKESDRNTAFMLGERNVILFLNYILEQAKK